MNCTRDVLALDASPSVAPDFWARKWYLVFPSFLVT